MSYIKTTGVKNGIEKWLESRERLEEILGGLKTMAFHLLGHLNDPQPITVEDLVEIHEHVDVMDKELDLKLVGLQTDYYSNSKFLIKEL